MATKSKTDKQPFASISDAQTWEKDKKYVSQIMDALGHSLNFRKGTTKCFKLLFKKEEYEYEDRSLGGGKSNIGEQRQAIEDQRKWNFIEDECDWLKSIAMRQTPHPVTIQQAKF